MLWILTLVARILWTTITAYSAPHQSRVPGTSSATLSAGWSTEKCSDPHTLRHRLLARYDPQSFIHASFVGFLRFSPLFRGNTPTPHSRSSGILKSSGSPLYLGFCQGRQIIYPSRNWTNYVVLYTSVGNIWCVWPKGLWGPSLPL
jgi:hypothetical protein